MNKGNLKQNVNYYLDNTVIVWYYDKKLDCDIKIKRHEEVFEPEGFEYRACHRGALTVRLEVNEGKLKQNSNRTVAWG